ncbi:MAG: CBS domain-containing protein [Candidatus Bathyarchaeia archaeon]
MSKASDLWWLFRRPTISIRTPQPLRTALRLMARKGFRHLPVVNGSWQVTSVLSAQNVLREINSHFKDPQNIDRQELDSMLHCLEKPVDAVPTLPPVLITRETPIIEVIRLMSDTDMGAAVVVDAQRILQGIVTLRDMVYLLGSTTSKLGPTVQEVMTPKPVVAEEYATVSEAISLMAKHNVRRLPVFASKLDFTSLEGVITSKDILRFLESCLSYQLLQPSEALMTKISRLMTKGVASVESEDDVRHAAYTMMALEIGGLSVRSGKGPMIGIVTERDLIHRLFKLKGPEFMERALNPKEDVTEKPSW